MAISAVSSDKESENRFEVNKSRIRECIFNAVCRHLSKASRKSFLRRMLSSFPQKKKINR